MELINLSSSFRPPSYDNTSQIQQNETKTAFHNWDKKCFLASPEIRTVGGKPLYKQTDLQLLDCKSGLSVLINNTGNIKGQ